MADWSELLGRGSIVETIAVWGILNQLIQALLGPFFQDITEKVNGANPVFPLSPADAAEAWVRNFMTPDQATGEARLSGIDAERFRIMKELAGDAPGPEQLAEMLRRKLIPDEGTGPDSTSFVQGIAEGRLADKWAEPFKGLAQIWPTPNDALDALLEGQLSDIDAKELYQKLGGDLEFFDWLFNTRGNAPTPMEALEMLNRGIIPETGTGPDSVSYEQAFLEGPWRNKWLGPFRALGRYVPPPRTVTALLRTGSVTAEQAQRYFQDAGMDATLAAAYVHNAQGEKLAGSKQLAEGTVAVLYETHAIDRQKADAMLKALGYDDTEVAFILQLSDLNRELKVVNSGITRVGTLYVNHKITRTAAVTALGELDVGKDQADHLLGEWDVSRAVNVRQLTPAQILKAVKLNNLSNDDGLAELVALGYTMRDAQLLIWNEENATNNTLPPQGPTGPGVIP